MSRMIGTGLFMLGVLAVAGVVWMQAHRQALDQLAARGASDLALAADRLVTQLIRYRETAVLMADHPLLAGLHAGGPTAEAEALLLTAVDKTAALTAFYADRSGRVLASAHGIVPDDLAGAAYFTRALQGALGSAHGSSLGFQRRAYSYAAPSFGPDGQVRGVLVVVVDIDNLEQDWRGSRPAVLFTDAQGEVFISNRSELLGWRHLDGRMQALDGSVHDITVRQVGPHRLWRQAFSPYVPERALYLDKPLPVVAMRAEALIDTGPARRLAGLQAAAVAALCLAFGAVLLIATERRRALAEANAVLEDRVAARTTALEASNAALRREIRERMDAEAALTQAQSDLVQAGKLSALGKMSAGISHELNQPLMAIRSFADNARTFLERDAPERAADNLERISDMARRMGRIISNLRAFARQESVPVGRVDLRAVLDAAVELTEAQRESAGVVLHYTRPKAPIWVRGGEVRLGQVFVNLMSNAVEAMSESAIKELAIFVHTDPVLEVEVRDTGPGIATPEKIFDPFYTTKSVGSADGMGLGLSISYGLLQSFGGTIRGENAPDGGAVFRVMLEPWSDQAAA